jgi:copper chaperone CopZ
MKTILYLLVVCVLINTACKTDIQHAKQVKSRIEGNCEMCEESIENAGNESGVSEISWNKHSKMARITFDQRKTNIRHILRKIANAGYDNEMFTAKERAYNALPSCCRYR